MFGLNFGLAKCVLGLVLGLEGHVLGLGFGLARWVLGVEGHVSGLALDLLSAYMVLCLALRVTCLVLALDLLGGY